MERILRLPSILERYGKSRSTLYLEIERGLFPVGIALGGRLVGWREAEVEAILAARISGKTDEEIRAGQLQWIAQHIASFDFQWFLKRLLRLVAAVLTQLLSLRRAVRPGSRLHSPYRPRPLHHQPRVRSARSTERVQAARWLLPPMPDSREPMQPQRHWLRLL